MYTLNCICLSRNVSAEISTVFRENDVTTSGVRDATSVNGVSKESRLSGGCRGVRCGLYRGVRDATSVKNVVAFFQRKDRSIYRRLQAQQFRVSRATWIHQCTVCM